MTPDTLSAQFVETFIADALDAQQARRASADLGLTPVSAATAHVLTLLTRTVGAQSVVEVGTGAGVSALAFFAGLGEDGLLTSVDTEAEHQAAAREVLKAAGIRHTRYRLITGEALTVLAKLRAEAYDIVFVDADFMEYPECLEEGLRIVRPGGLVILNHALLGGKVADETNCDDETMLVRDTLEAARNLDMLTTALIPVGDGLLVCHVS
ncbi:MAG: O-methyltransferase [Propionibacteriaceae bacterium]|jgi:predicted O-methyltransferase YrrM|nr:O-methyltransferase [Propionibacteriaceae bacterium]